MDSTIAIAQHALTHAMPGKQLQKRIKAEVILGSPGSGCQGVGICRIMSHKELRACKCKTVTAWITATKHGTISISFWKSGMEPKFIKRHFGWMLFQVFEPYELPDKLQQGLNLEAGIVQPGIYPVWESPDFLTVEF